MSEHLVYKETHQLSPELFTIPYRSNSRWTDNITSISLKDIHLCLAVLDFFLFYFFFHLLDVLSIPLQLSLPLN